MPRFLGVHWPRSAVPIGLAIGICFNTLPPAQGQASESPSVEAWCALDAEPAQQFLHSPAAREARRDRPISRQF
jgi:hypothetical protein